MIELNFRSFLSEFNASKFTLYFFLLIFIILFALRCDNIIHFDYFVVFSPLWIIKIIVAVGFLIGFISFLVRPMARTDINSRNDFFAMTFCFIEHCILFLFELLVCFKLQLGDSLQGQQLSWLFVCAPLFIQSFIAMIISIWSIRHDKSFEFELIFSINIIQFVFVSFKLDNALNWRWAVVFVPSWILFGLCFIGAFYSLVIGVFLTRNSHLLSSHRRSHLFSALSHILVSIPLLLFFVMLTNKLDHHEQNIENHESPFILISCPLIVSLVFSLLLSFGSKSGNTWWFAMRKPFCNYVFESFPTLQQYANISYKFGHDAVDFDIERPQLRQSTTLQGISNSSPSSSAASITFLVIRHDDPKSVKNVNNLFSIEIPD